MADYDEPLTLQAVPVPTLVVTANLDRLTVPEASVAMSAKAPRAELVRLSPGGHQGVWEQHAQFGRTLIWFTDRCFEHRASTAA
jgi:pimeloyl-ACP methyl ester carboxylesterase